MECERCGKAINEGDSIHGVATGQTTYVKPDPDDDDSDYIDYEPALESYLCDACGVALHVFLDGGRLVREQAETR